MAHFRQVVNGATTTVVADAPDGAGWEEVQPAPEKDEGAPSSDDAGQAGFPPKTDQGAQS